MTSILAIIKNVFGSIKNVFGFLLHRSQQNNRPEIVDNKERKEEQKQVDAINKAIKDKDVGKIQEGLAE